MTTTAVAERSDAAPIQGKLSAPPAIANAQQSAHYRLGQILKELIHASPHAFTSENQVLAANAAVDAFVNASVPNSARAALGDVPARASVEDVSKRVPPNTGGYALPTPAAQAIDYDKLAAAIVRAQAAMAQPEPATDTAPPAVEQQETEQYG